MIACARRPSSRSSQEMCEPMPGHEPEGDHLELAAERLVRLPGGVDLRDHRLARLGVERAHRRLVDAVEVGRGQTPPGGGSDLDAVGTAPSPSRCGSRGSGPRRRARAGRPSRARRPPRARRSRARRRARARCARRCGRTSGSRRGRRGRGAGGAPRPPRRPPARGSSAPPSSGSRGSRSTCATGLPSVRPWRTPAVTSARSFSIFIRPPRPWPSWRRARSASMSSGRSSSPAGSPSTIAVSPGPWDSPAVTNRKDMTPTPYKRGCGRQVGGGTTGRGCHSKGFVVGAGTRVRIRGARVERVDRPVTRRARIESTAGYGLPHRS